MGAYLSEPSMEKISEDGASDELSYGASGMQGWRVGMEDAHNCITKLTDDTALFAVYDGHGGAEVALYAAQHLPKLLANLEAFKRGDIKEALEEVFMSFDASLKQKAIIAKLRRIAGEEDHEDSEDDEETDALIEEADIPLEQLVARYYAQPSKSKRAKLIQSHKADLLSPVIQKKQPRFPLTANGTFQEGDVPAPNKTVPFDEEGDVLPKGERDEEKCDVNGPNGDRIREMENGKDSAKEKDKDVKEEVKTESLESVDAGGDASSKNGDVSSKDEKEVAGEEEAGHSGSCNGNVAHSTTKDSGSEPSSSGISSQTKLLASTTPLDDGEDDSDEDDEDYRSGDEEEDDEEDEDEDEELEEEDEEEVDRGDYDEEEEDFMQMQSGKEEPGSDSGSTAVVALLRKKELIVANIGDSRCVLSRGGKALDMSYDHKPEDDVELTRIEKAGGKVTSDGRVNGGLNLSRAFGDHCYKQTTSLPPEEQMISSFPDIQSVALTPQDTFMVVACDGIWNAMTSQEVIDFVQQRLDRPSDSDKTNKLSKICEELFDFCLAPDTSGDGTGCDNMTCVIVRFHHDGAEENSVHVDEAAGSKRKLTEQGDQDDSESKKPRH